MFGLLTFGLRKKMMSGEDGKNKALVRSSRRQEKKKKKKKKKKNDLDTSYVADKMRSSDDDSMVSIAKMTTRSKAKSGYKEKAAAPVKRRKFSRDPRLGAAQRIRESFREVIENGPASCETDSDLDGCIDSDDSEIYNCVGVNCEIDFRKASAELKEYLDKHLPKSGEEWFARYDAPLKDLEENEEKYLAERDEAVALQAVKFYNHKHSTNYVVEETLGSYDAEFDDGLWTHCNFRAKNTGGPAGRRPLSRLFFAELFGDEDEYKVDSCVTLDGPGRRRDIVRGCEMCPKRVCHPVNGFKNGHPDEYSLL